MPVVDISAFPKLIHGFSEICTKIPKKKIELTMYVKINTEEKQDIPGVEKQLVWTKSSVSLCSA